MARWKLHISEHPEYSAFVDELTWATKDLKDAPISLIGPLISILEERLKFQDISVRRESEIAAVYFLMGYIIGKNNLDLTFYDEDVQYLHMNTVYSSFLIEYLNKVIEGKYELIQKDNRWLFRRDDGQTVELNKVYR